MFLNIWGSFKADMFGQNIPWKILGPFDPTLLEKGRLSEHPTPKKGIFQEWSRPENGGL